jgi:hypothetical protein
MNYLYGFVVYPTAVLMTLYLLWQAVPLAVTFGPGGIPVTFLGIVAAFPVAVVVHELGHLVGALAMRLRVRQINLFGFLLDLDAGQFSCQPALLNRGGVFGYVFATPADVHNLPVRMAGHGAGGPIASLLAAVLSLSLAWLWQPAALPDTPSSLSGVGWQAWVWPGNVEVALCNQLAAFNFFAWIVASLPCQHKGMRNDGQLLLDCLRDRPGAFRALACLALLGALARGVRPRDWNPGWVVRLAGEADGSLEQGIADKVAYYRAEDEGRHEEAGRLLDRALDARYELPFVSRQGTYLEIAYFEGFHRGNAEEGRHWLGRVPREGIEDHTWLRAEAALLIAEGKHPEALALIESALEAVPRSKDRGGSIAERDWLERMRRHCLERASAGEPISA